MSDQRTRFHGRHQRYRRAPKSKEPRYHRRLDVYDSISPATPKASPSPPPHICPSWCHLSGRKTMLH